MGIVAQFGKLLFGGGADLARHAIHSVCVGNFAALAIMAAILAIAIVLLIDERQAAAYAKVSHPDFVRPADPV